MPEAKLAREAEICYATLAMVTDYDCWHEAEASVDVDQILRVLQQNAATAQAIIAETLPRIKPLRTCPCARALENAILTNPASIPLARRQQLDLLMGPYLRARQGDR
jgi:5'-methylthioadenosine phosphorylase